MSGSNGYPTEPSLEPPEVGFEAVSTDSVRIVLKASGGPDKFARIGVLEWMVYSPREV